MDLGPILRNFKSRIDAMVVRGAVELVKDSLKTQRVQVTLLADEVVDDVEHMQPYGLSFTPAVGSEVLALAVGGSRTHTIAVCIQNPDERPTNVPPQTGGLYTKREWRVYIDAGGIVHLGAREGTDYVALASKVLAELNEIRAKFDAHVHNVPGIGPSDKPKDSMGPASGVAASRVRAS